MSRCRMLMFWGLLVCSAAFLTNLGGCVGGAASTKSSSPPARRNASDGWSSEHRKRSSNCANARADVTISQKSGHVSVAAFKNVPARGINTMRLR